MRQFFSADSRSLERQQFNLIFVTSEDLSCQAAGDVNPGTANITNQGLQRSLLMGSFLHEQVLGGRQCNQHLRS